MTNDIATIAAEQAEMLENMGAKDDNPLTGDNVVDVSAEVRPDGTVREISVAYNAMGARITVDLYGDALTAGAGGETHRTHIRPETSQPVLEARGYWEMAFDGATVDA